MRWSVISCHYWSEYQRKEEEESANVTSAAAPVDPDGLRETLPTPRASFIRELRAPPQSH